MSTPPSSSTFLRVDPAHVTAAGANAAIVFARISWRSEQAPWRAPYSEMAAETGLTVKAVRNACDVLREFGWVKAERAAAEDATLVWSTVTGPLTCEVPVGADQMPSGADPLPERADPPARGGISSLETVEITTRTPLPPEGDQQPALPMLALVADPKPAARQRLVKRATQLPETWRPNDGHLAFVREHGIDGALELAQFRDHHTAKGSTMKDWDAAFRTWLRNAVKFSRPAGVRGTDSENEWMRRRPAR